MMLLEAFKMAFANIRASKMRSFLTMLGIIIGVAAVMIMVSVVQGGNKASQEYYAAMGSNKISVYAFRYNGLDITQDLYNYCLSMPELVSGVTPNGTWWGNVKYMSTSCENQEPFGNPQVYLGSDQFSICNNFTLTRGRDISYLDVKRQNKVAVLGGKLCEYLFQAQDPIGKTISLGGNSFEVVGVYANKAPKSSGENDWNAYMDYMLVVPYTLNAFLTQGGGGGSSEFTVKAKDAQSTTEAITRITGFLSGLISQDNGYFNVYSENTWQEQDAEYSRMMSLILGGIAGISLLVGGIGIMNIMLVTVTERTREIGIRKAIGGSRRSIILQFLIESSVLCGMGGFLGVVLGLLGTLVAGKLILNTVLLPSLPMTAGAVGFSVLLGVGFGLYPAIKASGLQPVDALRAD